MAPPRGEVLQGTLNLIMLKTLDALGPLHGYGIAQRIQQVSEDLLKLNQGTLYPALLRLEQRGWITSKWGISDNNRKAKAAIGIYGVVGFLVAQQTREIGVRMALGATPQGILRLVLSSVARWTISGAALGLLGAWLCSRLLESLLFQVHAHDPLLLTLALLILLSVAFLAAWLPARRAMRVDPMVALRYE